ncbi:MAG: NADH-quinone oxidoreductase subunit C [Oligoflexia bacterium]|nr:NADH-quinone oxidoreductase subunit C [Oligoflexia bacterium]
MNKNINKLFDLKQIKLFSYTQFENYLQVINSELDGGKRVVAHFADTTTDNSTDTSTDTNDGPTKFTTLFTILSDDKNCKLDVYQAAIPFTAIPFSYPSITTTYPQMHMFEREVYEEFNIRPIGHPALKAVRAKLNNDHLQIEGDEIHEVAVGPVHAGIIEPGHFRFQCHGEKVFHLEISLGYQHRGIEKQLLVGPHPKNIYQIECVAGDTTIGHTWAYCENIETLSSPPTQVSTYSNLLRALMLELERLANHVGDLGALANDVGFLPTSSYCGRIRGDYLNLTAYICGNRFGRSMLRPKLPNLNNSHGTNFFLSDLQIEYIKGKLEEIYRDTIGATNLLWKNSTVLSRFENTGIVNYQSSIDLGLVGVAARAAGVHLDCRKSYQQNLCSHYDKLEIATCNTGDVWARAFVRKTEIDQSVKLIKLILSDLKIQNKKMHKNSTSNFPLIYSICKSLKKKFVP